MTAKRTASRAANAGYLLALALGAGISDTLQAGNLPVPCAAGGCGANATSWVSGGSATATQAGNKLTVNQSSATATLNWQNFNIGSGSTVNFVQPNAAALAINNIFQGSPSQILGALNANGRVYLINQNGIVFGAGAQVNVAGLVASSLNLSQTAVSQGIASTAAGDPTSPSFVNFQDASGAALPSGAVTVAPGATLNATGGQIFLFAPKVTNQGTITTPDGQTILAAGNAVYLAASPDSDVRGLVVAVDAGGTVTNGTSGNAAVNDPSRLVGQIVAERGNVTLMGLAVNQLGLVSADTAVRANGSILLVASDRSKTGALTLGANSVTEAALDTSDTSLAVDATTQQKSMVELLGHDVTMAGGASVTATSGTVSVTGTSTAVQGSTDLPPAPVGSTSDGSRIYIADGATIDVSGATAVLPMSSNVLQVQLRGSELADDPTQRNGALRGQTVNVDVRQYGTLNGTAWVGTPLADLSADFATIQRGILERNETGGTVTLQSSGDVIVGSHAKINVSGGASDYQGGFLDTSSVIGANGQLYNIADASPNIVYTGVANSSSFSVTDQRWGVTTVYNGIYGGQGQYEAGYVQGADAGSLALNAPHVIFDGSLLAALQVGQFQRKPSTTLAAGELERPYDQLPLPGALTVGAATTLASPFVAPDLILSSIDFAYGPVLPTLKNADGTPFNPLTDPWPSSQTVTVINPALIGANAAGRVDLEANGTISVPVGVDLQLPAGGSFGALAYNIDVAGTISGLGASINLQTAPTAVSTGPSGITLQRTAVLNAAGAWVNDSPALTASPATAPLVLNGGSVSLAARDGNIALDPGALIDVSGGAQLASNGTFTAGNAGSISIGTSAPDLATVTQLLLGATLQGFAFQSGGSLSISASGFCITAGASCTETTPGETVKIAPGFFSSGGFGSYALDANFSGLELAPGTQLHPVEQNYLVSTALTNDASASTVGALRNVSVGTLSQLQRSPVNLKFSSEYLPALGTDVTPQSFASAPTLSLDTGSAITLDPLANVSVSSNTSIVDDARISTPSGSVSMTVTAALAEPTFIAGHQIWLGADSVVDVSGVAETLSNDLGNTQGSVLPGGTVSLTALRGAVETMPGSMINVSGTSATIDIAQVDAAGATSYRSSTVASAGGTLSIEAAEAALLSGSMRAASGNPSKVQNGSFSLDLNGNLRYGPNVFSDQAPPYPYAPRVVELAPSQAPIVIGAGIDLPAELDGQALISTAALTSAGFDAVSLQAQSLDGAVGSPLVPGAIHLNDNMSLKLGRSLTLDAAGFVSGGGEALLSAPYVSIGQSLFDTQTLMGATDAGSGTLQIHASMIDLVGHTAFGNFASVILDSSGDIRANGIQAVQAPGAALDPQLPGALTVSGSLDLTAQQIYPSTLTDFAITAGAGGTGNITIERAAGTAPMPLLSAGGTLSFTAPQIIQAGTVRAPLGDIVMTGTSITLARGSTTSTSADGQTIPFGATQGGFDWVYPLGSSEALVYGTDGIPLPSQAIQLAAASINIAKGAILDVKGGGDLLATEFIPGPTGTADVLGGSGAFAILPTSDLRYAPYDPYYSSGSGVQPGQSVYLSGGNGVPAGTYAILPARYALLPGAYYVTPVAGYQDLTPGQQIAQPNGSVIVSGYDVVASTALGASRTSGFDIQAGSAVQNLAQYTLTGANNFFSAQAKTAGVTAQRLPEDAGDIALSATTSLALNGTLQAAPASGGRGADVDISSAAILVAPGGVSGSADPNVLVLNAGSLSALGAESILLGGTRAETTTGLQITTDAASVEVASGATLSAPELLFAATNAVSIDSGATVSASGSLPSYDNALLVSGDGALLRVAVAGTPLITRTGSDGLQGQVNLEPGSVVNAPKGSLGVDAAASATFGGRLNLAGGSLSISGDQISLGNAPSGTPGIVVPKAVLNGLSLAGLSLASAGSIDFYDGSNLSGADVTLSAGALRGFEQGAVQVSASNLLTLSGSASPSGLAGTGTGTGTIDLQGGSVSLQAGALDVSGFSTAKIGSQGLMTFAGVGSLSTEGNLSLEAGMLTADSAAAREINVSGAFAYSDSASAAKVALPAEAPLGAAIAISAQSIAFDGSAQLHSGSLSMVATGPLGDVSLGSEAHIDVSAVDTVFDSVVVPSRAGTLTLQSQFGSVIAAPGSLVNVSAVDDAAADAGALTVQAASGAIDLNGRLQGRSADIDIDGQSFGNPALISTLTAGGFTGDWSLRLRGPGDLTVAAGSADAISARSVSLTADQGSIDVEGTIVSNGAAGGSITLSALNDVIVNGTLDARPKASGQTNGQIELATEQGRVLVGPTATIEAYDPSVAVQSAADGALWIRAPQTGLATLLSGAPASADLVLAGNFQGLRSVTIEGFQAYTNTSGTLGAADVAADMSNPLYAGAANFMASAPALLGALGPIRGPAPQIVPGIEIDAPQSLTLTTDWDLSGWRFAGAPGVLTLRSAGDLTFAGSLSDGFTGTTGAAAYVLTSTDPSWSYRLVAGADLGSSNPLSVQPLYEIAAGNNGSGSLTVAAGSGPAAMTMIRTGTGSIQMAAAGDVTLANSDSVVYTAGIADSGILYARRGQLDGLLYPTQGGDISISAGQDVVGAPTTDLVTNWLWRVGSPDSKPDPTSTAWTVNFADFEQGVAALGGGNVSVTAGRDIVDLSVSVPTVGRQVSSATPEGSVVQVLNQGDITLRAGDDVAGGTLYEGSGTALVVAGTQITQSPTVAGLYPMILLGDAAVTLSARAGATLAGVANPTLLPQGDAQGANSGSNYSYFSTYGANSSVSLQTTAGTAELVDDTSSSSAVINQYTTLAYDTRVTNPSDQNGVSSLRIYPGTLNVDSLRGGVNVDNTLTLYPEANGSVSLLAHDDVQLGSPASSASSFEIIESNADPALLPSIASPQGGYQVLSDQLNSLIDLDTQNSMVVPNAATPVHLTGSTPDSTISRIVSLTGSVTNDSPNASQLYFAAPARIVAGLDVLNLVVDFTNLASTDVSAIVAGRDIAYTFSRDSAGQINTLPTYVVVDGPGTLEMDAGRNVNLGTSDGVTSRGNIENTGLPSGGADISVSAGLLDPGTENYSTFIDDYLVASSLYTPELIDYTKAILGGSPTAAQALTGFESLPTIEQAPLIQTIFFDELLASGAAAAASGPLHDNFTRGYDAIQALFPGGVPNLAKQQTNPYDGDISLYFSKIYTIDGGSIDMLAPGGYINVGLATPPTSFGLSKQPSDLGVVAQSTGNVNAYSYGDFEVNESRVFAADGGNILIWSTDGNIDAGRGSKTAISAPAPTITFVNGVPTVTFPAALTGSGIQTLATTSGVSPGNVDLFAPNGVVNANDAGIVAGNLTIAATAVLGASNIKVSGVAIGVPVEATGIGAGLAAVSAVASSASQASTEGVTENASRQSAAPLADAAIGWLDVFVEGFGADVCKPQDVECLKRQSTH